MMSKNISLSGCGDCGSLRERKRLETRQRIAQTGLRLFNQHGYEGTTLDTIAEEAGVSRRTVFSYFSSKEEIILAWQQDAWEGMRCELVDLKPTASPLVTVRDTFLRHIAQYEHEKMIAIDRLVRSCDTLRARKQASYGVKEQCLYDALCKIWPEPERREELKLVAMISIGVMRIATENWSEQGGCQPLQNYLRNAYDKLSLILN